MYGKIVQEHNKSVKEVLHRLSENGLTINVSKCLFNQQKLKFFGHIFTNEGIYPDPQRIESIINLTPPTNIHELRSFLGMLNYVGRFIPNLSKLTNPLRKLFIKTNNFTWDSEMQDNFDKIKQELANITKMVYFDVNKRTHLHVDASPIGLGAVLSQVNDQNNIEVVAYASRSLTSVEQRYSQIERETLAAT